MGKQKINILDREYKKLIKSKQLKSDRVETYEILLSEFKKLTHSRFKEWHSI
jgi:hypothetical protein